MAGHRPPVIWSPEARDDIDRLWDYYAQIAGRATADKVIREIAKIVEAIDDFPSAGRARGEIRASLRSLAATPQVVFLSFEQSSAGNRTCSRWTAGYRRNFF
jgi:toxin ParE1/3/4